MGALGTGFEGCETFCNTDPPCSTALSVLSTSASAQTMNIIAHQVVALDKTFAAPRGPKAVWLPAPPKAPARSAALPLWSNTTMISTMQLITKKPVRSHPAYRNPTVTIPIPINNAMVHFIQTGIRFSLPRSVQRILYCVSEYYLILVLCWPFIAASRRSHSIH